MKKLLLALCATCAFGAPAMAQEDKGIDLGVTGYFKGYGVYVDQDEAVGSEARSVDIIRDMELHFVGSMTLDNGLTVGADVGAAADQGDSFDIQDSFVYFSGGFGRVNMGATDGAAYLLQVVAPSADANYDGMDQYYSPFNYSVTGVTRLTQLEFDYDQDVSSPNDKLTYITPVFGGFQAGVSYTPEARTASRSTNGVDTTGGEDAFEDIWDVAARFEQETGFGSYRIGAGYTFASNEDGLSVASTDPADDRQAYNAAIDFDIGNFGVGAVYTFDDRGSINNADSDQTQYIVGADYTMGATTFAVSYLNQNNEFGTNEIDTDRYTAGATYNVGPGIDLRGVVTYIDHSVDAGLGNDVSGTGVMLGTSITF